MGVGLLLNILLSLYLYWLLFKSPTGYTGIPSSVILGFLPLQGQTLVKGSENYLNGGRHPISRETIRNVGNTNWLKCLIISPPTPNNQKHEQFMPVFLEVRTQIHTN